MNEVGVTEADASDNPQYVASNIVGKKVWVVSAGRVIATFNDSAVTTIDVGFEDLHTRYFCRNSHRCWLQNV